MRKKKEKKMIVVALLIFILPVIGIIGLYFLSNIVGKRMRVILHKENEPPVDVGFNNGMILGPLADMDNVGRAGVLFGDDD